MKREKPTQRQLVLSPQGGRGPPQRGWRAPQDPLPGPNCTGDSGQGGQGQAPNAHCPPVKARRGPGHLWCQHQQMKLRGLSHGVWQEGGWGGAGPPRPLPGRLPQAHPASRPVFTRARRVCVASWLGRRGGCWAQWPTQHGRARTEAGGHPPGDGSAALGPSLGERTLRNKTPPWTALHLKKHLSLAPQVLAVYTWHPSPACSQIKKEPNDIAYVHAEH